MISYAAISENPISTFFGEAEVGIIRGGRGVPKKPKTLAIKPMVNVFNYHGGNHSGSLKFEFGSQTKTEKLQDPRTVLVGLDTLPELTLSGLNDLIRSKNAERVSSPWLYDIAATAQRIHLSRLLREDEEIMMVL